MKVSILLVLIVAVMLGDLNQSVDAYRHFFFGQSNNLVDKTKNTQGE